MNTAEYEVWAEFRYQIRRYLHTAEAAAREEGLEPQQHQLLLAVAGFPGGESPSIGEVAERLQLRHHSTVELVDRLEQKGLVLRRHGAGRIVALELTPRGERLLGAVSNRLRPELDVAARQLIAALRQLSGPRSTSKRKPRTAGSGAGKLRTRRSV